MEKKKAILNKKCLSEVLLWLLLLIVFIGMYILVSNEVFRMILYALIVFWGADRFIEWIDEE